MEFIKILFFCMFFLCIIWIVLGNKKNIWMNISDKVERVKDRNIILFVVSISVIIESMIVLGRKLPFVADEVYSMSGAAYFAGYNWSDYMSLHKFYNFGYTMLLSPLYKIFTDPITIYRGMLFTNVLVFVTILVMTYYIARKHLSLNKLYSTAIAVTCSYNSISLFFKGYVYNELPLAFIVWTTILLLLELIHSEGKRRICLSLVLGIVVSYAYLVHSRCLILFGTLAILVILYLLVYKRWIFQPICFGITFVIVYFLEKLLLEHVQTNLYLQGADIVMPNSVEHMATGTWQYRTLTSPEGIGKLIMQFFSLSGTMTIETGGLITIVSAISLYFICKNLKRLHKGEESKELFLLTVFSFVSFWGMVVCIALFGASNSKTRFLLYSRYFAPFIGPFLLLGLNLIKKNTTLKFTAVAIWSSVLNFIVILTFLFYSLPRLDKSSMKENASLYLFMPFARYEKQTTFSRNVIFIALMLLVIFSAILLYLYRRKQFVAFCAVAVVFSTLLVWKVEDRQNEPAANRRYNSCDATYYLLKDQAAFSEEEIYCIGDETYRKTVLVSCYDLEINYNLGNMQLDGNEILLANNINSFEKYQPKYIYQLDENEWIGVWDKKFSDILEQNYELH